MYEDLIKALRHCWVQNRCDGCPFYSADKQTEQCSKMNTLAADTIEELIRENESLAKSVNEASEILRRRWIPVTERLPKPYTSVLLYSGEELYTGYMHSDKRFTVNASHFPDRPTHWMPLPEPPKEGE